MNNDDDVWKIVEGEAKKRNYKHKSVGDGTGANNSDLIHEIGANTDAMQRAFAEKYPQFRSVYVCRGLPGDPLIIDDKQYILYNEFLAVPSGYHFKVEQEE